MSTSMASCAAAGRGDVRGVAVASGGSGGIPCGGVILIVGGALTVSTSMAVDVEGGGGAGSGGDGLDRRNRCRRGAGGLRQF